MTYLTAFFASLIYIFLKASQQRHVQHAEYWRMPAASLGMAFCEVFVMVNIIKTADNVAGLVLLALCIGIGAAIGSMTGTYWHVRRNDRSR